jgi:hypothetical protein
MKKGLLVAMLGLSFRVSYRDLPLLRMNKKNLSLFDTKCLFSITVV